MSSSATVPDAQSAGSSPAPSSPALPVSGQAVLDGMTSEQRGKWELTGELPTTPADPSSATPAAPAAATAASPTASPTSEPERPAAPKEKGAKARTAELDQEITDLRERLRIRAELRRELASTERPPDASRSASSPGQPTTQAEYERYLAMPEAPTFEEFEANAATYGEATAKFTAAMGVFIADQRYAEYQAQARGYARAEAEIQAFEQLRAEATASIQEYAKTHPDFDQKVDPQLLEIPTATARRLSGEKVGPQHVLAEVTLKSSARAQLLEHFSSDEGYQDWQRLVALPYHELMRAFGRLEGRFDSTPAPAALLVKTLSDAPAPGAALGTRPTEPIDPAEAALKRKDFSAYEAAMNAQATAGVGAR